MNSSAIFTSSIRVSLTAKLPWLALLMLVSVAVVALLAAQFSGRQPATVALDSGLSVIRLMLPVCAVFLLQELLFREFDRRLFLTSLAYPNTRSQFLLGRVLAVLFILLVLLIVFAGALAGLSSVAAGNYRQSLPPSLGWPYVITIAFLAIDVVVATALGTLLSVIATSAGLVLIGTLGLLLVARSYAPIIELLSVNDGLVNHADVYESSLGGLAYFLPDLSALDVRMIALYNNMAFLPADWAIRMVAALIYAIALFALAAWALNKKRFS